MESGLAKRVGNSAGYCTEAVAVRHVVGETIDSLDEVAATCFSPLWYK